MKTSYKPSKLPAIAAQVRKEHPTSSEIKNYQLDNSFLDEVRQWAKLPKEDVDGEAITIPIRKVRLLANYVPANSLHLPLLNLTRILFLRANEEIARSLFILWQDYFTNQDLCYLLYFLPDLPLAQRFQPPGWRPPHGLPPVRSVDS